MSRLLRSMKTLATLNAAGRNYASKLTGATVALHPVYLGKLITFHRSGFTGEIQRTNFSTSSYESLETMPPQPFQATNFRYLTEKNYPVKLNGATVALHWVYLGKLITVRLYVSTDQTISGGQIEVDISFKGVSFHSEKLNLDDGEKFNLVDGEKCNLHDGMSGNFVLTLISRNKVDMDQGIYCYKVKLLSNDGHELSCVAFDFPVREDLFSDP